MLQGNKLDYILIEYVHMIKTYYCEHLLVGTAGHTIEANAGSNLKEYVQALDTRGLLLPGSKLLLARVQGAGDLDLSEAAIKNLESAFGPAQPIQVLCEGGRLG